MSVTLVILSMRLNGARLIFEIEVDLGLSYIVYENSDYTVRKITVHCLDCLYAWISPLDCRRTFRTHRFTFAFIF